MPFFNRPSQRTSRTQRFSRYITTNSLSTIFSLRKPKKMAFFIPPTYSGDAFHLQLLGKWKASSGKKYQFIKVEWPKGTEIETIAVLEQPAGFVVDPATWTRQSITLPEDAIEASGLPAGTVVTTWWAVSPWVA